TLDGNRKVVGKAMTATKCGEVSRLEYATPGDRKVAGYRYTVLSKDGGELYSNTFIFPTAAAAPKLHTMKIAKPLYKELLSRNYPPQRDFHGFQWMFGAGLGGYTNIFGLQTAIPTSDWDIACEHKATGMANYANVTMIDWLNTKVFSKELGTPLAIMPRVLNKNVKSGLDYNMPVVPEIKKLYLDDVRTIASAKDRGVRLMVFGDEMAEVTESVVIENFKKHPDNVELQALDKKIKEKYGQGRYGIPKTAEEGDPLAWIAYRRGINEELVALFHEAYALAKSINPELIVVTDDPVSNMSKLYSFADWRGAFDIATHQLYPRNNAAVDSFGFMTRYLAQLTDAKEIWPCAHVEEYGASMTPEEVLCKLSACVRNGATGFHYYLNDSTGRRSKKKYMIHERWGAPDRYEVELNAQKLLSRMPRLKVQKYDSAVFVATDSLRAVPGLMFRRPPTSDMYLHGFMGYGAGVNYRFINELTMQNLKGFKFIATVSNEYIPKETFEQLKKYVKDGGTLIVINQNAFSHTPEGADLAAERAEFTGIAATAANDGANTFIYKGITVPTAAIHSAKFTLAAGAKVLASFDNGTPAVVEKRFGKGRVLTLAANPCIAKLAGNAEWNGFFLKLAKDCGAKVSCDIWRFQLPDSLLPKPQPIPGKCLTDNYVKWEHYIPRVLNKGGVTGSYTLSPEPKHVKDVSSGEIPFAKGKLTDRPRAVVADSACEQKGSWANWAVSWRDEEGPITISCKLSEQRPLTSVKLFVSGIWQDAALEIGGRKYEYPCPKDYNKDPLSVRMVEMKLPQAVAASDFKVTIGAGKVNLTIAEMEIWSE
ncbi:MAG: beta-galactosidase trimerization domain-containing protein, partial [Victivallales bacterium]|nr:beta-galactosidase trimerization domain-containing protein [Victivallales bacterium]